MKSWKRFAKSMIIIASPNIDRLVQDCSNYSANALELPQYCTNISVCSFLSYFSELECGKWYHHPWRQQHVFSRNLRNYKVATCHRRCRRHLKIIVFDIICYVDYYSAAKFKLQIQQPSYIAVKCGIRRSWKLKVKQNLDCRSNIALTTSYISIFVSSW